MTEKKEVMAVNDTNSPESLISQAIEKKLSVETISKLMDLKDRWDAKIAKREFDAAMAKFQGECPVIKKSKDVKNNDGTKRYGYAPLDVIVTQVGPIIARNELSYTINAVVDEKSIKAIVRVTHAAGHSQESSFVSPIGKSNFMNDAQSFASALTYAKRYAFCNAFGILTGDVDDDAKSVKNATSVIDATPYSEMLKAAKSISELTKIWSDIPANVKPMLKSTASTIKAQLGGPIPE